MKKNLPQGAVREDVLEYLSSQYGTNPEYLWMKFPGYAVFRRTDNQKWYSIIMDLPKNKIGLSGSERVDVMDVKCTPLMQDMFLSQKGFLPGYHLNRDHWMAVLLDGTVDKNTVFDLLDMSYELADGKAQKRTRLETTHWLIPANPKYFDLEKAFAESDTILWKQSNSVIVGDTVYIYMGAPFSCVRYRCRAVEVDIPYQYDDGNVRMKKVMKLQRLHTYDKDAFGLDKLKEHGIVSVRGPRSVPYGLLYQLEKEGENNG